MYMTIPYSFGSASHFCFKKREMGVFNTGSTAADEGEEAAAPQQQQDLDAGALFVLKSKGISCILYHPTLPPFLALLHISRLITDGI